MHECAVHGSRKNVGVGPTRSTVSSLHSPLPPNKGASKCRPHKNEPQVVRAVQHAWHSPRLPILLARMSFYLRVKYAGPGIRLTVSIVFSHNLITAMSQGLANSVYGGDVEVPSSSSTNFLLPWHCHTNPISFHPPLMVGD